ncbi:unnamed protein product [Lactuca saligna]|uniref:MULE transposase domain-containing protein n=1 Tax=Lactuca saligna TaxID=75948 RepID=A0AA35YZA9_LACSI|nr:unnamed protein product [Lactuca saligna]
MKVYTEHGETRLHIYFLNPELVTKVTIVQLDEPHEDVQHIDEAPDDQSKETLVMTTPTDKLVDVLPTQANQPEIQVNEIVQVVSLSPGYNRRKVMSKDGVMAPCSKKIYFDDIGETEQIAKDFVEAATDFDIGLYQQILQSNVDGVNGTDMHDVNEPQMDQENQTQTDEENQAQMDEVNQAIMNDFWDFDYQTDAFFQDGSENQPQSNMDSNGKERSETKQEDDSDDSDHWVDEDNVIEDVEVDMRDFNMSIDTEVEFLDKMARNPRQHESDEEADGLDVIDNDAFDSLDDDSDQDRKRRAVLKQLSNEKSCLFGELTNPDTTVKLVLGDVSESNLVNCTSRCFKRIYVCLGGEEGLLQAVSQLFPCAEHRLYLRHIHENMKKQCRTKEYRDHLWDFSTATTVLEFNHYMHQFSLYDKSAYEWLKSIPQHWEKSHFTGRATTDMLLNKLCEVFNGKLVDGRDKPIIICLEFIREYMMKRVCNVLKVQQKCVGPLTPIATKIMEKNEAAATQYIAEWCDDEKYQVKGPWNDQHVVDIHERIMVSLYTSSILMSTRCTGYKLGKLHMGTRWNQLKVRHCGLEVSVQCRSHLPHVINLGDPRGREGNP